MAGLLGVAWEAVELEHVGLNHLSWERAVRVGGQNMLPDLLKRFVEEIASDVGLPPDLIRLLGVIPSYYLRYYYLTDEVLQEQRSGSHASRAAEVMAIEAELLEMYRDPALDRKPSLLERRGGAFYSEAAARLMASLSDGTGDVQIVDIRNEGAIPDLPDDAVVEIPARIDRDGAHPAPLPGLQPELAGLVEEAKAYERLTVEAATTGSRTAALKALVSNPLVPGYTAAAGLLDALLETNRVFLDRFFPGDSGSRAAVAAI
jgi:6-phospho-beta-glucosidase